MERFKKLRAQGMFSLSFKDTLITLATIGCATALCMLLRLMDEGDTFVSMIFLLAVVIVSRLTTGYVYGIATSVIGVLGVNYAFTAPYFEFCLSASGYPLAFISMFAVALITSTMTSQIKQQDKQYYKAQVAEMRANLLRAVSHDLRTPLTSISGAASVLLEQPDIPRAQQELLLKDIIDDSGWLVRMVENLLSITRINSGPANLHKSSEAVEEVVSETVRKFHKRFANLPVAIEMPEELALVPMDPILIEQVLMNLLENVALHAETATRAVLRFTKAGGDAVFEVSDDGVGIASRALESIFEPGASHTEGMVDSGRSMGIGLSVCKAIIVAHGGDITAKNNAQGGACFRFTLPLEEEKKDEPSHKPIDR